MVFTFLNGGEKSKKCFVTCENDRKFKSQRSQIKFYWHTAMLIQLCIVYGCRGKWLQRLTGPQSLKYLLMALLRENLPALRKFLQFRQLVALPQEMSSIDKSGNAILNKIKWFFNKLMWHRTLPRKEKKKKKKSWGERSKVFGVF